jgi:hypothetical protein
MSGPYPSRLTDEDIRAEGGTLLPSKEVLSLLDLALDVDLMLDLASPIDLAVAANANIAAPISAAAGANVLSPLSSATSIAQQDAQLDQFVSGEAIANAPQTSVIDQADVVDDGTATEPLPADGSDVTVPDLTDPASLLDGNLLNVDVNVALDADLAAPVAGAVAANANVAAPIDAAVAANVGSVGSTATAVADQQALITQNLEDVVAEATADQDSTIEQGTEAVPPGESTGQ